MPALSTQVKLLRAMRNVVLGDGKNAFGTNSAPKPDFITRQDPVALPRCQPEEVGLSSAATLKLYKEASRVTDANLHSLIFLRKDKIFAEGYFSPFRKDVWHVTHSLCKTIVGLAVGMAVDEGLLHPQDSVLSFFPKEGGLFPSKNLRSLTVHHLLCMASGLVFNEVSEAVEESWVKGILTSGFLYEPGTSFNYNSMNSYLLAAILCKVTKQSLTEFLRPRLLDPLGFGAFSWEKSPEDIEKGGWGLYMMTEDMIKLGLLFLQKGMWQGKRLVSPAWIRQSMHLQMSSEWNFGYGYQCWIDPQKGNTIMNGMFGQYVIIHPKHQMVCVMTAGNPLIFADSAIYHLVADWMDSLPPGETALPPDWARQRQLRRTLEALQFRTPLDVPDKKMRPLAAKKKPYMHKARPAPCVNLQTQELLPFCGRTWKFRRNKGSLLPIIVQMMNNNMSTGVKAIHLLMQNDVLHVMWEELEGTITFPVGLHGRFLERRIFVGTESFLLGCTGKIALDEEDQPVLIIQICFLEHSSFRQIKFKRNGDNVFMYMDEQPQFMQAIQSASQQSDGKNADLLAKNAVNGVLANLDYLEYRLDQLTNPQLRGTLVEDA